MDARRKRFLRWAESRTRKAIDSIRKVKQMGNRSAWSYKEEEADKICSRLEEEVASLRNFFSFAGPPKFRL